jgi:hypothetical protein
MRELSLRASLMAVAIVVVAVTSSVAQEPIIDGPVTSSSAHGVTAVSPAPPGATVTPSVPSLTIEQLNRLPLDGLMYNATLAFLLSHTPGATSTSLIKRSEQRHKLEDESLHASVNSTPSQYQVTSNSLKDVEPTSLTTVVQGVIYTPTVAIQEYSQTSFANIAYLRDSNGGFHPQQTLPLPGPYAGFSTGYNITADPLLRKAPSTVSGQNVPNRVFCAGLGNSGIVGTPPYAVTVWYTDDGGVTWSNPVKVSEDLQPNQYLDKPSIDISQYPPTAGEVYVAYTRFVDLSGHEEIHVARSTDGGATFTQDHCATVDASNNCVSGLFNASQLMVDSRNGAIYVLFVDFGGSIMATSSTNFGLNWSVSSTVTNTPVILGNQRLNNNTIAGTILVARYNAPQARVNAVWHAYDNAMGEPCVVGARCSDIYLATKAAGQPWNIVPLANRGVSNAQDQFQPALDNDSTGNILIAYYSRKDDPNDQLYKMYTIIVSADGLTTPRGEEEVLCSWTGCQSDPNAGNEAVPGFIGDYHDVFLSAEYGWFQNAFVARPSLSFEIFSDGVWY